MKTTAKRETTVHVSVELSLQEAENLLYMLKTHSGPTDNDCSKQEYEQLLWELAYCVGGSGHREDKEGGHEKDNNIDE